MSRRATTTSVRRKNGWTKRAFNAAMRVQDKRCAICGWRLCDSRPRDEIVPSHLRKLAADHDHETGKARGILCRQCNTGIGMLQDNPEILEGAAAYIRRYRGKI